MYILIQCDTVIVKKSKNIAMLTASEAENKQKNCCLMLFEQWRHNFSDTIFSGKNFKG